MNKLTPEQMQEIIDLHDDRTPISFLEKAPLLLDHIKALEEENARLLDTIDILKQDAHPWHHLVEQDNARYKEVLEQAFNECQKTTLNDCGELRSKVYDILYNALKGADAHDPE